MSKLLSFFNGPGGARLVLCILSAVAYYIAHDILKLDINYERLLAEIPLLVAGGQLMKRAGEGDAPAEPGTTKVPGPFFTLMLCLAIACTGGCRIMHTANWPAYVKCGEQAVPGLIADVTQVLVSGTGDTLTERGADRLNELAASHGAGLVACLITQLINDWSAPGSAMNPELLQAARRGHNFLQSVGTSTYTDPLSNLTGSEQWQMRRERGEEPRKPGVPA